MLQRKWPHQEGSSFTHLAILYWTVGPGSVQGDRWQEWVSLSPLTRTHDSMQSWQPFLHAVFLVTVLCFDNQTLSCPWWLLTVLRTDFCHDISWQNPIQNGDEAKEPWLCRPHTKPQVRGLWQLPALHRWCHFLGPYESPLVTFVTLVTHWGSKSSKGLWASGWRSRLNIIMGFVLGVLSLREVNILDVWSLPL